VDRVLDAPPRSAPSVILPGERRSAARAAEATQAACPPRTPSFEIRGASGSAAGLRLDRINSREVFRVARQVYFHYLETCPAGAEPIGVVILTEASRGLPSQGRVVFELPVLLPEEQYLPLDLLRGQRQPLRARRAPASRSPF